MRCERCNKTIESVEVAHSMVVVLQKVDMNNGYSYFQCEQGSLVDGHHFQHWHCNREEMRAGVTDCISNHYAENNLVLVPKTQVRLHTYVLGTGLACKQCQATLTSVAYRFCLTHATPVNSIPDQSHHELGEWCCSLDHARTSALATISQQ